VTDTLRLLTGAEEVDAPATRLQRGGLSRVQGFCSRYISAAPAAQSAMLVQLSPDGHGEDLGRGCPSPWLRFPGLQEQTGGHNTSVVRSRPALERLLGS
jgi:hypothetical protein